MKINSKMEQDSQDVEQIVTLCFESGEEITQYKSFLIDHSFYFEAMFGGSFMETRLNRILIQDICYQGFCSVIENSKNNYILLDCIEDILLLLKTAQLLQFTGLIRECIKLIEEKWLLTIHAVHIFSLANKLGLKELSNKACICILYYFKTFSVNGKNVFLRLTREDLQLLLSDSGLNVENEKDVFDLIIDWCSENKYQDVEYELAVACVRFNIMNIDQLKYCLSRISSFELGNTIKQYINYINDKENSVVPLIKPARSFPNVLCAANIEEDGCSFVYRWDWSLMMFTKFFKVNPLPKGINGIHIVVKGIDIFVLGGRIACDEGTWKEGVWKYNMAQKEWKVLKNSGLSLSSHRLACFCKDNLYLFGSKMFLGQSKGYLQKFQWHEGEFIKESFYSCDFISLIDILCKFWFSFEHNGQLAMINTEQSRPRLFLLDVNERQRKCDIRETYTITRRTKVIAAVSYQKSVYVIGFSNGGILALYSYCPAEDSSKLLHIFRAKYNTKSTMCAFNINNAMVFGNDTLEYYCLKTNECHNYSVKLDSFHSNYFLSIPFY